MFLYLFKEQKGFSEQVVNRSQHGDVLLSNKEQQTNPVDPVKLKRQVIAILNLTANFIFEFGFIIGNFFADFAAKTERTESCGADSSE